MKTVHARHRLIYLGLIVLVVFAGLASRSVWAEYLPDFVAAYAGDTLWALMLFLVLGVVSPRSRTIVVAAQSNGRCPSEYAGRRGSAP